jgi:hypothetical protein
MMPHPRVPKRFVGRTEYLSIEAASYPRTGTGSSAPAGVADVIDALFGAPTDDQRYVFLDRLRFDLLFTATEGERRATLRLRGECAATTS